jgi:DNA repair photolyase
MARKPIAKPRLPEPDELPVEGERRRGRGARSNSSSRFDSEARQIFDDGWDSMAELEPFKTEIRIEQAKSIIATNDSPDIGFDQSINVYRGCEHGCIYCYARPTHCYLGLSAGLDFESVLIAKTNAAELLEKELAKRSYRVKTIALGTNTDPYQPIERRYELTRQILQVMERTSHPVSIVTKSASILRDLDILASLARRDLVKVWLSVTTLDRKLARNMEPRASTPERRLEAMAKLNEAGVPAGVMVAPILPALNDPEIETILQRAHDAGARNAGYVLLRLPLEISGLFQEWLQEEFPDRASRVMKLMRSTRGGKDYVSEWGERQTGTGPYAELIAQRFRIAVARLGMNKERRPLRSDLFTPPLGGTTQFDLFKSV